MSVKRFCAKKSNENKTVSARTAKSIKNATLIPLLILVSNIRKNKGPVAKINRAEKGSAERISFIDPQ